MMRKLYEVILTDGFINERYIVKALTGFAAIPKAQQRAAELNKGSKFVKLNIIPIV